MSRIRSIKPEFWSSAQVMECSVNARLLFIGLWNFCDDAGRHVDNSRTIKAEVFPGDDLSSENVRGMIDELVINGLLIRYTAENKELLQVTGWHHQRIDHPQKPRYPGPEDARPSSNSTNVPRTLAPDPIRSDPIRSEEDTPPTPLAGGRESLTRSGRKPRDFRAASNAAWAQVSEAASRTYQRKGLEEADPALHEAVRRCGGWNRFGHSTAIGTLKAPFREAYEAVLEEAQSRCTCDDESTDGDCPVHGSVPKAAQA